MKPDVRLRDDVRTGDAAAVREIIASSGFFTDAEIGVAVELVDERLARGLASGYRFLFAESDGRVIGYTCFGEIACTVGSYDLYWIAVHEQRRAQGLGRELMNATERAIAALGGRRVYIETSGRPLYEPTRQFYLRCGCEVAAVLPDFYAPGDAKYVFVKVLA